MPGGRQIDERGPSKIIAPGATQQVSFTETGNGASCIQLGLETVNAGDSMDILAFAPALTASGSNLIPAASQDFSSGWTSYLGSSVTLTQAQPALTVSSLDYLPFGELNSANSGYTTHMFTGDERDSETNLDHTWFRQYSSSQARWMSPDPASLAAVDPSNPQSWNRYAYVFNNPMIFIDPAGLITTCVQTPPDYIPDCTTYPDDPSTTDPHLGDLLSAGGGGDVANWPCGGFLSRACGPSPRPPSPLLTLKPSLTPSQLKKCTDAQAKATSLKQQLHALNPNKMLRDNIKDLRNGALIGCTAEALAVGACAHGAIAGAMTAEAVFVLSNAGDLTHGFLIATHERRANAEVNDVCQP